VPLLRLGVDRKNARGRDSNHKIVVSYQPRVNAAHADRHHFSAVRAKAHAGRDEVPRPYTPPGLRDLRVRHRHDRRRRLPCALFIIDIRRDLSTKKEAITTSL